MSKFHEYSVNNTILICRCSARTLPMWRATRRGRKVSNGRCGGERGIKILAPARNQVTVEQNILDPQTQQLVTEQVEMTQVAFKPVTVFDISQTEEPLPQLGVHALTGSVAHYAAFWRR